MSSKFRGKLSRNKIQTRTKEKIFLCGIKWEEEVGDLYMNLYYLIEIEFNLKIFNIFLNFFLFHRTKSRSGSQWIQLSPSHLSIIPQTLLYSADHCLNFVIISQPSHYFFNSDIFSSVKIPLKRENFRQKR